MTTPLGDVAHINAMVTAQQLKDLQNEKDTLYKALNSNDKESYKETLSTAK